MTARNPTTFIVGAGPVATALAGALRLGGVPVLGLWGRTPAAARAAGAAAGVAAFSSAPPDIPWGKKLVGPGSHSIRSSRARKTSSEAMTISRCSDASSFSAMLAMTCSGGVPASW